ncbi:P-selectin [Holothuria leucospilota]|uniref:p-selectin n=1 Tax=Holothuria leucospilota TaxID=206669 RepID=A0A9Q0YRY2_HOLLE|nr:P-selectin [Holothuria leucospilota]
MDLLFYSAKMKLLFYLTHLTLLEVKTTAEIKGYFQCSEPRKAVTCSTNDLPDVTQGSFDCPPNFNVSNGGVCTLTCDDKFYSPFSNEAVCETAEDNREGKWSDANFVCHEIMCIINDLPEVTNGSFACFPNSSVSFGDACALICNDGFYSPYSNQTVCERGEGSLGGMWSDGDYVCHPITCTITGLPGVLNGSFECPSISEVSYGDFCTIKCNNGFYSAFSNNTVCEGGEDNQGGKWSDRNIACREITCDSDNLPGIVDGSFDCAQSPKISMGEACAVICDDGFYPAFSDQVICETGEYSHVGRWSEGNFTCHEIMCSTFDLPEVTNGSFACFPNSSVSFGDVCALTCNDGFYSPYSYQTVCERGEGSHGGMWSDGDYVCHPITCPVTDLPDVANGSFDCPSNSEVSYGDFCTIICNNGFYSAFFNNTVCEGGEDNQGGKWSDRNIACRAITCSSDSLPGIIDGSFDCAQSPNISVGETCAFVCDDGFYPAFSEQVMCETGEYSHEGRWSEGNFTCHAITCSTTGLPNVENGTFACPLNSYVPYSHSCSLICTEGFYSPFSNHAVCEAGDGTYGEKWSDGNFACHEIKCSTYALPEVPNGSFDCPSNSNVSFAGVCNLICNVGFYSLFANQAVCGSGEGNEGGKWSGGNFLCLAITCSTNDLPEILNGSFDCPPNSNVSYDDACTLTCNGGFYPPFSNEALCDEKEENQGGKWSEANFACHAITCSSDDLPGVTDGLFDCTPNSNISMGDVCTLTCNNGFYPTSSDRAVCESREDNTGGKWSDGNFTCHGCTVWTEWRGNEYKLTSSKQYADSSSQVCENDAAHLVSIENHEENSFVQKIVSYCDPNKQIWIGLNDVASPGDWRWTDGTTVSFTNWASSQPNNGILEKYVYMKDNGNWYDYPVFHSFHAVCKRSN